MVIFWDIDGTLMYCGADGTVALNDTFRELYGLEDAFTKAGIGRAVDSVILDKIMKKEGIPDTELPKIKSTYIEILEDILRRNENKRALPGIRELISFAEREGHINSLLTSNLKEGAYAKLRSVDLDEHFVGGGFGDIKGEKWDIAVPALKEIEALTGREFEPEDVIIIGDSAYDIETARKRGFGIISVATGWTNEEDLIKADPDILFKDFSDTDAVIDAIERTDKDR